MLARRAPCLLPLPGATLFCTCVQALSSWPSSALLVQPLVCCLRSAWPVHGLRGLMHPHSCSRHQHPCAAPAATMEHPEASVLCSPPGAQASYSAPATSPADSARPLQVAGDAADAPPREIITKEDLLIVIPTSLSRCAAADSIPWRSHQASSTGVLQPGPYKPDRLCSPHRACLPP